MKVEIPCRYFDRVDASRRCFSHTVRRYFPVANLTRTRQAVIVEPLRPEHFFVRTFNATSLYILSICEVRSQTKRTRLHFEAAAGLSFWIMTGKGEKLSRNALLILVGLIYILNKPIRY